MFDRDTLLKDLRENAIAFFLDTASGRQEVRLTLMPKFLPESYLTEMSQEKDFHTANPTMIAAWNILHKGWVVVDVNEVAAVQVLDEYNY